MRLVKVTDGDTLGKIAERYLGNAGLWPKLYLANEDVIRRERRKRGLTLGKPPVETFKHPADLIFPGTRLRLPPTDDRASKKAAAITCHERTLPLDRAEEWCPVCGAPTDRGEE